MKHILVIDDERDVLEVVRSVLKTKGYKIRTAESGEDGLRMAEDDRPDMIICDLMMPKVSGLEVIKRLKKHQRLRTVPIVVLSAVGSDDDRPDTYWAKGLGVDEYVAKPFDPLDLLGRVEYIFRRQDYRSTSADFDSEESAAAVNRPKTVSPDELENATPAQVARAYAEAWNAHDFATEYRCLDAEVTGQLTLNDYIARRHQTYREEKGHTRTQTITKVLEEKVSGNVAKIIAEREDNIDGRVWPKIVNYMLKKTHKGWKIIRYTEKPRGRRDAEGGDRE
ncbi:response regulator [bacterium]|nr:response regulator [bacterium]